MNPLVDAGQREHQLAEPFERYTACSPWIARSAD